MTEDMLQLIPQKYKGPKETTMNNYTPANWTIQKKCINPQKHKSSKTESGRNRKSKQIN